MYVSYYHWTMRGPSIVYFLVHNAFDLISSWKSFVPLESYGFFVFRLSPRPSQEKGILVSLKISQGSSFNLGALLMSCSMLVNVIIPCLFIPLNVAILGWFSCFMRTLLNSIFWWISYCRLRNRKNCNRVFH